jgi:hypothetical protein
VAELGFGVAVLLGLGPGLRPAEEVDAVELEVVVSVLALVFVVESDWGVVSLCFFKKKNVGSK